MSCCKALPQYSMPGGDTKNTECSTACATIPLFFAWQWPLGVGFVPLHFERLLDCLSHARHVLQQTFTSQVVDKVCEDKSFWMFLKEALKLRGKTASVAPGSLGWVSTPVRFGDIRCGTRRHAVYTSQEIVLPNYSAGGANNYHVPMPSALGRLSPMLDLQSQLRRRARFATNGRQSTAFAAALDPHSTEKLSVDP